MKKPIIHNHIGDPSDIHQHFHNYTLQLLCCRYWWLKHWEYQDLSFPYWRLYYNKQEGASIYYKGKKIDLCPNKLYLIAPNTPYSTQLFDYNIPKNHVHLEGDRIQNNEQPEDSIAHLFIHFNLGFPYDQVKRDIISMDINEKTRSLIDTITDDFQHNATEFSFRSNLYIRTLINQMLCLIPIENWQEITQDRRIIKITDYIDNHLSSLLDNKTLSQKAQLATNSFTRLFTDEIGISPQRYVKKQRIDKACILLHHSNKSIESIATETGFADRYHFSRVFKQVANISPAVYRKLN